MDGDKNAMRIKKDQMIVLKGKRTKNNMYKVQARIVSGGAGVDEEEARRGHILSGG